MEKIKLFNLIIEAAEKNADNLDDLLRIAIEQEDEEEVNLLLDKVHQIMKEGYLDAIGWKIKSQEGA